MIFPSICKQRILDPLEINHIKYLVELELKENINSEELAHIIKKRTAGIPRFVKFCINMLKDNPKIDLYQSLLSRIEDKHPIELRPYMSFSRQLKEVYIELARISLLKLPVQLNMPVPNNVLWKSAPNSNSVLTVGDCIKLLNLYIMNANQELKKNEENDITPM